MYQAGNGTWAVKSTRHCIRVFRGLNGKITGEVKNLKIGGLKNLSQSERDAKADELLKKLINNQDEIVKEVVVQHKGYSTLHYEYVK